MYVDTQYNEITSVDRKLKCAIQFQSYNNNSRHHYSYKTNNNSKNNGRYKMSVKVYGTLKVGLKSLM
jgi:hypothetical protein